MLTLSSKFQATPWPPGLQALGVLTRADQPPPATIDSEQSRSLLRTKWYYAVQRTVVQIISRIRSGEQPEFVTCWNNCFRLPICHGAEFATSVYQRECGSCARELRPRLRAGCTRPYSAPTIVIGNAVGLRENLLSWISCSKLFRNVYPAQLSSGGQTALKC